MKVATLPMMAIDWSEPEDIANVVLFLATDDAKYLTAHEIAPDSGVTEF